MYEKIKNPVLTGFHPDPAVCRRGDDYYLAVSSFEWYPGVPVYHSRDLKNWRLLNYCIRDERILDLRGLAASRGIWAPCLSWCEADGLFYLAFSVVRSIRGGVFDLDNYIMTARDIEGEWSSPVYIHSAGFDPSVFHDDDGRKYVVSLEWETRDNHYLPGEICIVEYDAKNRRPVSEAKRIYRGGTCRGWVEGPHIYKHGGWYYLLCAEGGTYYNHCVSVARSRSVFGPYEPDPQNPVITSKDGLFPDTHENWNSHPEPMPDIALQRAGHASIVETSLGEVFAFHLCGRPFLPEVRCTLGRETAVQRMEWTEDGWLRMKGGGRLAREETEASALPERKWETAPARDDFDGETLRLRYICPRIDYSSYASLKARPGFLRLRGQDHLASTNRVSLIAHKLTSLHAEAAARLEFSPRRYAHYAGICVYYDECNHISLRKTWSDEHAASVLEIVIVERGEKSGLLDAPVLIEEGPVQVKILVDSREIRFYWARGDGNYRQIGDVYETVKYADEYGDCGDNTGTVVGIFCTDAYRHELCADFDWFEYWDIAED